MVKKIRVGFLTAVCLVLFVLYVMPAWAASGTMWKFPATITSGESSFRIEAQPNVSDQGINVEIKSTDYSKLVPIDDYYVSRSVDVSMANNINSNIQLSKPVRMVFSFDIIDFKRASKMNTSLSPGHFRVGFWDEYKKNWVELPSQVFWNGYNGAVEAEAMQGAGRYALLWSFAPGSLSPVIDEGIRVMVDHKTIQSQVAPYVKDGRTMVPLRVIAESLNVKVEWIGSESRIDLRRLNDTIQLWIGRQEGLKNNQKLTFEVAPEIVDGRSFVPLRFVVEAFGAKVSWDEVTRTAGVFSN